MSKFFYQKIKLTDTVVNLQSNRLMLPKIMLLFPLGKEVNCQ
jgi:hypothetical protein